MEREFTNSTNIVRNLVKYWYHVNVVVAFLATAMFMFRSRVVKWMYPKMSSVSSEWEDGMLLSQNISAAGYFLVIWLVMRLAIRLELSGWLMVILSLLFGVSSGDVIDRFLFHIYFFQGSDYVVAISSLIIGWYKYGRREKAI